MKTLTVLLTDPRETWCGILGRAILFIIFFWFGMLKVVGASPVDVAVAELLKATMPLIPFAAFFPAFGIFEMLIGILLLFPRLLPAAIALLFVHMSMTFLPLIFLPEITWSGFMVPTLTGQYIIKNLIIIALALSIAHTLLHPRRRKSA